MQRKIAAFPRWKGVRGREGSENERRVSGRCGLPDSAKTGNFGKR